MKTGSWRAQMGGFVFGVMFSVTVFAKTPPPYVDGTISDSPTSWQATGKPSSGLALGRLTIKLEETALSEVLSAVKSGFIQYQGDAADSVYWLCYTALTDSYDARIWLEASGEMGGPDHRVTNIAVRRIAHGHAPSDCPMLPKQFQSLSFNSGVWLGASKAAVKRVFPHGLLRGGEQAFIGYQGKEPGDGGCDGGYDLLNSLYLTFQAGVVVAIDVGQVTSC